jgi:hypothetical protein
MGPDTIPRKRAWEHFRLIVAVLTGSLLGVAGSAPADQIEIRGISFTVLEDGQQKSYSWAKVVQDLNTYLSDAQQVNIYNSLCRSGLLIEAAQRPKTGLKMPWVIGTAVDSTQLATGVTGKDENPPGRLKGSDGEFYGSYTAYLTKYLQSAPTSTVKQLHDKAAADVKADPELKPDSPQYAKTGNDGMTLYGGTKSSHALVFAGSLTDIRDTEETPADDMTSALKAIKQLNSVQYYVHNFTKGGNIDGPGTSTNWTTALKNLQTQVQANKGQEVVDLFLLGHSFSSQANATPAPNAIPDAGRQGIVIVNAGNGIPFKLDIAMTAEFWRELAQDVTGHDPSLIRGAQPEFFLGVSESSMAGSFSVAIDGLSVGTFFIGSNPNGALLDVPLSDSFLANLIKLHGQDSSLELEFTLASSDTMRLALENDIYFNPDYQFGEYGTGLKVVVAQTATTPEPSGVVLAMIGAAFLPLVRRQASGQAARPAGAGRAIQSVRV